jgi:glycosyltransferase involved in cell wall biosynthesis
MMQRVLIIQALMKQFRVPFFSQLHAALRRDGIDLRVAYSAPNRTHALRQDNVDLPAESGHKVPARWVGQRLLYQPLRREIMRADLVITGPENKYLNNLWLLPYSALGLKTVAFWGLGPNMHPDRRSAISEWIKARQVTSVDWWFAYTESVANSLRQHGMPADRITIVQNATDTTELRRLLAEITENETAEAKKELTGNAQSKVGIYCGRLEHAKALPFLLESARLVKKRCPEFHLVIVGNGPDRAWLEQSIINEPWIHYMGSQWGRESALLYRMADLFLLPGSAGLAVVDSFAAGLPLIATELPSHPPEISYLRDGEEGRITAHRPQDFADAVIEILSVPELMVKLRRGAEHAGSRYTMEAMVENFRSGVTKCLANRRGSVANRSIGVAQEAERDSVV